MELVSFLLCPYLSDKDYISLSRTSKATREGCRRDYSVRKVKKYNSYLQKTNFRFHIDDVELHNQILEHGLSGRVHTLNLSNTCITDVSMLGKVHTLNLS